jgi:hypothetical protein
LPHFDPFYEAKLRGTHGIAEADAVLDLKGTTRAEAEALVEDLIERSRFAEGRSVALVLDPPPPGGGETLFQPSGLIGQLQTLPAADGLGFFVALAGRGEA